MRTENWAFKFCKFKFKNIVLFFYLQESYLVYLFSARSCHNLCEQIITLITYVLNVGCYFIIYFKRCFCSMIELNVPMSFKSLIHWYVLLTCLNEQYYLLIFYYYYIQYIAKIHYLKWYVIWFIFKCIIRNITL